MKHFTRSIILLTVLLSACVAPPPTPPLHLTATPTCSSAPSPSSLPNDVLPLISPESLFAYLDDLTAIQPYSGWRNSATAGEAEALDYVAGRLGELIYLAEIGMTLEQQSFEVLLATELWETRLALTVGERGIAVPAEGLRGSRNSTPAALRLDSDGVVNDAERNPVVVSGAPLLIRQETALYELDAAAVRERVVLLDFALVDTALLGWQAAFDNAMALLDKEPAGIVLVVQYSNQRGESHGSFVGDSAIFSRIADGPNPPVLYDALDAVAGRFASLGAPRDQDVKGHGAARSNGDPLAGTISIQEQIVPGPGGHGKLPSQHIGRGLGVAGDRKAAAGIGLLAKVGRGGIDATGYGGIRAADRVGPAPRDGPGTAGPVILPVPLIVLPYPPPMKLAQLVLVIRLAAPAAMAL